MINILTEWFTCSWYNLQQLRFTQDLNSSFGSSTNVGFSVLWFAHFLFNAYDIEGKFKRCFFCRIRSAAEWRDRVYWLCNPFQKLNKLHTILYLFVYSFDMKHVKYFSRQWKIKQAIMRERERERERESIYKHDVK